ncbi:MAG: hypothetical protein HY235_29730 [Acidobacteria bacterium]|nr:hypothetical protein [Acidobacteriota bacterium]
MAFLAGLAVAAGIAAVIVIKKNQPAEPAPVQVVAQQAAVPAPPAPEPESRKPSPAGPVKQSKWRPANPPPARPVQAQRQPESASAVQAPPVEPAAAAATPALPPALPQPPPPPQAPEPARPAAPPEPQRVTVAAGTLLSVRLAESISSDRTDAGQKFQATLDQPLVVDGFIIAERGSRVEGRVVETEKAGRVKGVSHLTLELAAIHTADGQRVAISTETWKKQGEESHQSDATKVAVGTGLGAALGAIFGGGRGAAIGAGSGAAAGTGVVLATRGKPVTLPAESRITFKVKAPLTITEKR